jgi:hypothetical protein
LLDPPTKVSKDCSIWLIEEPRHSSDVSLQHNLYDEAHPQFEISKENSVKTCGQKIYFKAPPRKKQVIIDGFNQHHIASIWQGCSD